MSRIKNAWKRLVSWFRQDERFAVLESRLEAAEQRISYMERRVRTSTTGALPGG